MTERTPKRAKLSLAEYLSGFLALFNLCLWAVSRFIPPVDDTQALAYMALAVAWTAIFVTARRRP